MSVFQYCSIKTVMAIQKLLIKMFIISLSFIMNIVDPNHSGSYSKFYYNWPH